MGNLADDPHAVYWLEQSEALFYALKREFALGDTWEFSIARPDSLPTGADPRDLRDIEGAVAFMLRRIQAIRNLLIVGGPYQEELVLRYAADLYLFLHRVVTGGLIENPLHEGIVFSSAESTKNLLAAATNPSAP